MRNYQEGDVIRGLDGTLFALRSGSWMPVSPPSTDPIPPRPFAPDAAPAPLPLQAELLRQSFPAAAASVDPPAPIGIAPVEARHDLASILSSRGQIDPASWLDAPSGAVRIDGLLSPDAGGIPSVGSNPPFAAMPASAPNRVAPPAVAPRTSISVGPARPQARHAPAVVRTRREEHVDLTPPKFLASADTGHYELSDDGTMTTVDDPVRQAQTDHTTLLLNSDRSKVSDKRIRRYFRSTGGRDEDIQPFIAQRRQPHGKFVPSHAVKQVPATGLFREFRNRAEQSRLGTGAIAFGQGVTGNNLGTIADLTGGDSDQVNLGTRLASEEHPVSAFIGSTLGNAVATYLTEGGGRAVLSGLKFAPRAAKWGETLLPYGADALTGIVSGEGAARANGEDRVWGALTGGLSNTVTGTGGRYLGAAVTRPMGTFAGTDTGQSLSNIYRVLARKGELPIPTAADRALGSQLTSEYLPMINARIADAERRGLPSSPADVDPEIKAIASDAARRSGLPEDQIQMMLPGSDRAAPVQQPGQGSTPTSLGQAYQEVRDRVGQIGGQGSLGDADEILARAINPHAAHTRADFTALVRRQKLKTKLTDRLERDYAKAGGMFGAAIVSTSADKIREAQKSSRGHRRPGVLGPLIHAPARR